MAQLAGFVSIVAKDGKEAELAELLAQMHAAAVRDDGCDLYTVMQPRKAEGTFLIFEAYRDRDALVLHQQNPTLAALGASLGELAASVEVKIGNIVAGDQASAVR